MILDFLGIHLVLGKVLLLKTPETYGFITELIGMMWGKLEDLKVSKDLKVHKESKVH